MNILIAEDETSIRNLIKMNLESEGFTVFSAIDGIEALQLIQNHHVDLAIFDIMMPKLDGFNLLRRIRPTFKFPVMILTARGDDMDKVLGLGIGADDYLVKPFSMAELMARVASHLRRNNEYKDLAPTPFIQIRDIIMQKDSGQPPILYIRIELEKRCIRPS